VIRLLLQIAALVVFAVAALFGAVSVEEIDISQLDLIAGGLALWCASTLPS